MSLASPEERDSLPLYLSIVTLNRKELNYPIKRYSVSEWIKNRSNSDMLSFQETHFRPKDIHALKIKGWKDIFHANSNEKKAGAVVIRQDRL